MTEGAPPRSHTVVLADERSTHKRLFDALTAWSAAGLLRPLGTIDLSTVDEVDGAAAAYQLLTAGQLSGTGDLTEWLADNYCDVIRLVYVRSARDHTTAKESGLRAERLREQLIARLGPEQRLISVQVWVGPIDDSTSFPESAVTQTWSVHLAVGPVEHALPSGASARVEAAAGDGSISASYATLVAETVCTAAGIWSFMDRGCLDDFRPGSGGTGVRAARGFVRLIDVPDPTPDVTLAALRRLEIGTERMWPLPHDTPPPVPAQPAKPFIEHAGAQLATRHAEAIEVVDLPRTPRRPLQQVGLWEALKMFFRFMIRGVKQAPRVLVNAAYQRVSTAASTLATSAIFGQDSAYQVVVGRPVFPIDADTEEVQQAVEDAMRSGDPALMFMPQTYEDLWRDYINLAVALIDGSPGPSDYTRPQIGNDRALVQNPSDLAPPPDFRTVTIPAAALGDDVALDVKLHITDPKKVLVTQAQLRERLRSLGVDPSAPPDQIPSDADDDRRHAIGQTRVGLELIARWLEDSRRPYTWLLGERIAKSLLEAESELLGAMMALTQQPPQRPDDDQMQIRRRRVLRWLALGLAAGVGFAVAPVFTALSATVATAFAAVSLVLGFAGGFVSFMRELRRRFQLIHAYEARVDALNEAVERFRHFAMETLRLNSVCWQYQRWSAVLTGLVHGPFGAEPPLPEQSSPLLLLPSSRGGRSAGASVNPELVEALVHRMRREIFTPGWLRRCAEEATDYIDDQFCRVHGLQQVPDPYSENIRRQRGLLEFTAEALLGGWHGAVCRRVPNAAVRDHIAFSPVSSFVQEVRLHDTVVYPDPAAPPGADPVTGLLDELEPSDASLGSFHPGLWRHDGVSAATHVERTFVGSPLVLAGSSDERRTLLLCQPVTHGDRMLFPSVRLDLSEPCKADAFVFFGWDGDAAHPVTRSASAEDLGD